VGVEKQQRCERVEREQQASKSGDQIRNLKKKKKSLTQNMGKAHNTEALRPSATMRGKG
jgi:hypothetical protein